MCISNKFPDDANVAGVETIFWKTVSPSDVALLGLKRQGKKSMLLGFCRRVCPVGGKQQGRNTPVSLSSFSPISVYLPLTGEENSMKRIQ